MNDRFALHTIKVFLLIIGLAGFVWMGFDLKTGVYFVGICFSIWLLSHLIQIGMLIRWLSMPKLSTVPRGLGIWQDVFNTLLSQAKSRKKRKQQLSRALQRFYKSAEAMPNGVIILDENGRIEWANPIALDHFNLNRKLDFGSILVNLMRMPDFHAFMKTSAEEHPTTKIKMPMANGQIRTLHITHTQVDRKLQMLTSQDITDVEKINRIRSDFVANVSHELRTPLTVINGFLETLSHSPSIPEDKRLQFLGLMQKEGDRMLNLLNDLLTLSKLENDHQTAMQPINLSALCTQLSQEGMALSKGKHHISTQIDANLWMEGIQLDLYNALSNLLFNAIRYTLADGVIDVSLKWDEQSNEAIFSVTDNGPGIASEHIDRVTERFYRVDSGRSRNHGGTGLGLAITKHALAEHHATLFIESTVGVGSTFSTRLKLMPQIAPEAPIEHIIDLSNEPQEDNVHITE